MENRVETDLTQGSVVQQLIKYAIPMVTTSLLQALYSMTDIIIAGHFVGSNGISAINNSSQIMGIITNIAIGLTVGGNILVGQYFGAGDKEKRAEATGTLFTLSVFLGILFMIATNVFAKPMLIQLGAPALEDANAYLKICTFGLIFIFGYNAMSAVLRAIGNSKQPFYFIAAATGVNVVLDLLFMGPLQLGTSGAALATMIAQGVSFFSALFYLLRKQEIFIFSLSTLKIRIAQLKMILKLGIPTALQQTIGGVSWLVVTF